MASSRSPLAALREQIVRLFDETELRTLCFDLGVDYENLSAVEKAGRVRELVSSLERTDRIPDLVAEVKRLRPKAQLPRIPVSPSRASPSESREDVIDIADIGAIIADVLKWFEDIQNPNGGLPTDDEGSASGTWATIGVLWSAWTAGVTFRRRWMRRALQWVSDQQSSQGGIPICRRGDADITDATALTLLCLRLATAEAEDRKTRRALVGCAEWLLAHRTKHEGWKWREDDNEACSLGSTSFALRALWLAKPALKSQSKDIGAALDDTCAWLHSIRNTDGGWGARSGDPSRPAVTALVTLALLEAQPEFDATPSTRYVLGAQERDGAWPDTIERPSLATVTRMGTASCLQMLAAVPAAGTPLALVGGLRALLTTYERPRFRYRDTIVLTWPTRDALLALTRIGYRYHVAGCRHNAMLNQRT